MRVGGSRSAAKRRSALPATKPYRRRGAAVVAQDADAETDALIEHHLAEIEDLSGDDVRVTLFVRDPHRPDGSRDLLMTTDDMREAISSMVVRLIASGWTEGPRA